VRAELPLVRPRKARCCFCAGCPERGFLVAQVQLCLLDLGAMAGRFSHGIGQGGHIIGMQLRQPVGGDNLHRRQPLIETLGDFGLQRLGVLGKSVLRCQQVLPARSDFRLAAHHVIPGHGSDLYFNLVVFQKLSRVTQCFPRHADAFLVGQQVIRQDDIFVIMRTAPAWFLVIGFQSSVLTEN